METLKEITIIADKTMVYTRVINTLLNYLPDDYPYFDDVFELQKLAEKIDQQLRRLKS